MHKQLLTFGIITLLSLGLTACAYLPGHGPDKIELSPVLRGSIAQFKTKAALLLDAEGRIVATDENGKTLERCSVKRDDPRGLKQCKGLQKGATIENVNNITALKSHVNPDCLTLIDGGGFAHEYCWD